MERQLQSPISDTARRRPAFAEGAGKGSSRRLRAHVHLLVCRFRQSPLFFGGAGGLVFNPTCARGWELGRTQLRNNVPTPGMRWGWRGLRDCFGRAWFGAGWGGGERRRLGRRGWCLVLVGVECEVATCTPNRGYAGLGLSLG